MFLLRLIKCITICAFLSFPPCWVRCFTVAPVSLRPSVPCICVRVTAWRSYRETGKVKMALHYCECSSKSFPSKQPPLQTPKMERLRLQTGSKYCLFIKARNLNVLTAVRMTEAQLRVAGKLVLTRTQAALLLITRRQAQEDRLRSILSERKRSSRLLHTEDDEVRGQQQLKKNLLCQTLFLSFLSSARDGGSIDQE